MKKRCFKCGAVKPLSDFYAHKHMADGHLNKCKGCTISDVRSHYRKTKPERQEYERERASRPERRQAALKYQAKQRIVHRGKYLARQAAGNAIRDGRLLRQPCEVCGTTLDVEAHHDDYSKPLNVRWLCFRHHREHHGQQFGEVG